MTEIMCIIVYGCTLQYNAVYNVHMVSSALWGSFLYYNFIANALSETN